MNALATIEKASRMLAEVQSLDDALKVRSAAVMLEYYAKEAKLGKDAENNAAAVRIRAERKAGEYFAELKRGRAGRPGKIVAEPATISAFRSAVKATDAKPHEVRRWQEISRIPAPKVEKYIEEAKAEGRDLTAAGLLKDLGAEQREKARRRKVAELGKPSLTSTGRRFAVLLADPPWPYETGTTDDSRRIENQYPTMTLAQICALEVPAVSKDNAVLFLWSPAPKLDEAMQVIRAWGYTYRTHAVWDKERIGMGYFFRSRHENLLVAERGSFPRPPPPARADSIFVERRTEHSSKPKLAREIIDAMYPEIPKLELFARGVLPDGWHGFGNEYISEGVA